MANIVKHTTIPKYRIRREDKVKVLAGKDIGKIGKVIKIHKKTGRVLVENVNMVKRHKKPDKSSQGGIVDMEAPIRISNVMLVCNKCLKPSRIRIKKLDDGKKVRTCIKCNEIIDS